MSLFLRLFLSILILTASVQVYPANAVEVRKPVNARPQTYAIDYSKIHLEGTTNYLPGKLVYVKLEGKEPFVALGGYTEIDEVKTGYSVSVVSYPSCQPSLSCTIAYSNAEKITAETPSIEDFYSFLREPGALKRYVRVSPDPIGWRTLSNGNRIYFVPWVLGASMGFAQAVWDEGEFRYTIALKGGTADWLTQMVESIFSK